MAQDNASGTDGESAYQFLAQETTATNLTVDIEDQRALRELGRQMKHLAKIETALLKTMADAEIVAALEQLHQYNSTSPEVEKERATRDQIVSRLRQAGEVHSRVGQTVAILLNAFRAAAGISNPEFELSKTYLSQYLNDYRKRRTEVCEKVLSALQNPNWDFRTVGGIANETGLDEATVLDALEDKPELFRKSPVPDKMGRSLYTLASRPVRIRERIAIMQNAFKA